ncbi:amidase [Paenibacillus macquariensis subsp. macquariensis]|nr:amidase [Paenibacillus macquariensis subsp. macquariensis]
MKNTRWKKIYSTIIISTSLALTIPLTANSASSESYTGDAALGIELKLGSVTAPANQPISSSEWVALLDQSAKLAGSSITFSMTETTTVSRKNAAYLLYKSLHLTDEPETFTDIGDDTSLSPIVGAVVNQQLMNGVSDTRFEPNRVLTQSEASAVAYRVYELLKPFILNETTISDIQDAVSKGKLTYEELTQMYLDRIEKYDDQGIKLNAIITVNSDALKLAKAMDVERVEHGVRGPLHGIPIIVKDNYATADMPTTAGCLCLKDSIPSKDAELVAKLKSAGAIIIAKANLDEFALNTQGTSSLGGQTLNPYALDHYPGGSSAGTGASVAANFALAGFGTDTGGSIRIPLSYNNLVGIRPTIGLSSRDGIIPLALTQDVGGPMARTVTDAAILLDATAGYDKDDVATAYIGHIPATYTDSLVVDGLKGSRIGVATELFGTKDKQQPVSELVNAAVDDLKRLGATTVPITIPNLAEIFTYPSLSRYESKTQLNEYLAEYAPDASYHNLSEIIESGQFYAQLKATFIVRNTRNLESQEYKDIVLKRTKLSRDAIMKVIADNNLDAIVYPSTTQTAAEIGGSQDAGNNNRLSAYTGYPAISVPAGFTSEGLAAGIEFMGRTFDEATIIKLAYSYEQGTHNRMAPVLVP